jgi:hypothetical protein
MVKHLITLKLMPDHNGNDTGQLEVELHKDGSLQLIKTPEKLSFLLAPSDAKELVTVLQKERDPNSQGAVAYIV